MINKRKEAEKAQISTVIKLQKQGLTVAEIAQILEIKKSFVKKLLEKE